MFRYSNVFGSFSVNNLEEAKMFYQETLGLHVKENDMGLLELHLMEGRIFLIYSKPEHKPADFTILNFSVDNIEETADLLIDKGIFFEQYSGDIKTNNRGIHKGAKDPSIAWFKDPSGNIISIIEN